ncbi:probable NOT transcription complex subunit VIP2 isoform X2 [Zingiber officinale]|uniref:probable NOT transcription complex subunit VIP2 isoform X2 n=1 Tax=Zingiber officinale TaxID=94328 RepID=UPI001C4D95D7|nr:probable NOT transcription complex subunit VIP2 isoform X2 [Zingiber officinale]
MSWLLNSTLNGSTSNLADSSGRPYTTLFSGQSAAVPGFHPSGGLQGLHNIHGSFNLPNVPGSLASREAAMGVVPSGGVQQPGGSIPSGRFSSNNLLVALSQMPHGSGVTNRGGINVVGNHAFNSSNINGVTGSITGISSSSASGNRSSVPGFGVSPVLGNVGPRLASSVGNIVGSGNMGRSISSGGLSVPGLASRVNLATNNGSGSLNVQGTNRLISSMLQQATPQMIGMLGSSYPTSGGSLSRSQGGNNPLSSMGMLNTINAADSSPFDMNDFPQLTSRPSSAGGQQGHLGAIRKQGVGVSSIVQQNHEFSIQNEDFPALPGYKGGSSDFSVDLHQKEQLHENISTMQSQHLPMTRSGGFSLGGTFQSNLQQQQLHTTTAHTGELPFAPGNTQDLRSHGSDFFPSHGNYHSQIQNSGDPSIGLRPLNSPTPASGMSMYEQLIQQYQQPQSLSQLRLQQMSDVSQSYRDQNVKSTQGSQLPPGPFGMLGLLSVINTNDPDLTSLALGIDLTTVGLSLSSTDSLYKTFGSPWSDEPAKGELEYCIPTCYYAKTPPPLHQLHFSKFQLSTLFYIFYSMPKDEAQLYAASELYAHGWFYHRDQQLWFTRVPNSEPLVKTHSYERGSYLCFDPNTWSTVLKEHFVLHYEAVEKKPVLPSDRL